LLISAADPKGGAAHTLPECFTVKQPPDVRSRRTTDNSRRRLRASDLLASALRRAKRHDFANPSFIQPLERLLSACNEEANLSLLGARALKIDVLRCLRNLLHFDAAEDACPSIVARPIVAPVFITGMPRSGTTFLHRLILQDPGTAGPRLFQLVYPYASSASPLLTALRKRTVSLQLAVFRLFAPELNALHPVGVDAPEECTDITAQVFQSSRFESMFRVPSYTTWLERRGFLNAYHFHRRFLQHLDSQLPGRRWILKSPDHIFALDDLRTVYPDARLVFVHRDPVRVLASVAKLTEVLRRPFARSVDRLEIGQQVSASWLAGAQKMCVLASSGNALHLHYRQVVSAPLDAVRALYRYCDLVLTEEAEGRMRHWLRTKSNVKRAPRSYQPEEFGLDARLLRERFARYTDTFGIENEYLESEVARGAPA
jgi:Sulfotransferase family